MRALLLAAGEGTRLRPLTLQRPQPMLPLGGRPILEYLVDLLRCHGVEEIAINVHYKPYAIVDHFGDGARFGVSITYSPEAHLLGSAGAAKQLEWFFTEPFLVLYGDVLTDIDLTALTEQHLRHGGLGTLALYEVEDPTRCGVVKLDQHQRITQFVEKPATDSIPSNLANAGIYVLEPAILDYVARASVADFGRDVFPAALAQDQALYGSHPPGYILDIGSPERYRQAEADLLTGRFSPSLARATTLTAIGGAA
jgi:NDP-sugar pyrophosphorylase family protein